MAAYIPVPRDLTRVKTKVFFNLTKRQLLCFGAAALIGVPIFFLVKATGNVSLAALSMMIVMLPLFFLAMYEKDVLGKRRVTKESFERWYASQTDYRTVEDQELDADIMASTYGLPEMARMLGVHRQTIYYIVANEDFELIKVGRYKRATKESFEKWYHNQTRYQLAEDRQERS